MLNMAELCSVFFFCFFFTMLKWVLSCGRKGRGREGGRREGIEGAGQRLAKSDKRAVGRTEERTARGEGKRKEREQARVGGGDRKESDRE